MPARPGCSPPCAKARWRRLASIATLALAVASGAAPARELRVCADPDDLPFSDAAGAGFENRIAALIARDLDATLVYAWKPRAALGARAALDAGACDLAFGVPAGSEGVRTTRAYYRSRFAFVVPADDPPIASLRDPRLAALSVGVPSRDEAAAVPPPPGALVRTAAAPTMRAAAPQAPRAAVERAIDDVESGRLDAALAWGPQAAWFAGRQHRPMVVVPARGSLADEALEFAIAVAVRRDDAALAARLDAAIARAQPAIDDTLRAYGVPRTDRADVDRLVAR